METRTIYREGSRVFLDARPRARYGQARVDGAYSLPGDDFAAAFATLDPPLTDDVPVLIYGEGPTDESPARVAEEMLRLGWKDVAVFPAGWQGWTRGKPATADTRR
jgi:rhodanese-related sulfurtransferase